MHLYKSFFRLLKRNMTGIIIYACIFVAMLILLFVIARVSSGSDTEFSRTNHISYIDNDNSALSRGLIRYLSVSNEMSDFSGKSESSILDIVFFGISEYHMTIDKGFADGINRGEDIRIPYKTNFDMSGVVFGINGAVNNYINAYRDYKLLGASDEEAAEKAVELLSDASSVKVVTDDTNPKASSDEIVISQINQFFCYLTLGFLALGVGHTIIASNDVEVGKRIDASPVTRRKISLVNTAGLITAGVAIWLLFMIINIVFGSTTKVFTEYWWVIMINSFLTMLVCCSIASLITSFGINSNTLSMITNIVSLSMSFLCGVFVPQWLLGDGVLTVARFLPFYWSVYANNMTYASSGISFDMHELMVCFGIQILYAAALALVAAFVKNSRLSRV